MKCLNDCGKELTGKQRAFCSDKCRMQHKRADKTNEDSSGCVKLEQGIVDNPNKSEAEQTTRTKSNKVSEQAEVEQTRTEIPKIQDTPEFSIPNFGQPDCHCQHCQTNRANGSKHTINHGAYKPAAQLAEHELNRITLPGDVAYERVCKQNANGDWYVPPTETIDKDKACYEGT